MPNLFRHLTDYARSHLTFSSLGKNLKEFSGGFKRDCFVAALLAMTLFSPLITSSAFAADDEMTVSVPEYIEITRASSVYSSLISINDSESASLNNIIHAIYNVYSNGAVNIYLYVTVPVAGNKVVNAWNGIHYRGEQDKIVFVKNDNSATEDAVSDALSDNPSPEKNKNVIAFEGYPTHTYLSVVRLGYLSNGYYVSNYVTNENSNKVARFMIGNSDLNSCTGTFSPHDSAGIYTATVTVTTIAP